MDSATDSTTIDLDLPPPTDDDFVNPSYVTNPADVNHDVSHSFSVVDDGPQLTLPFKPHDAEADPGHRLEPVKTDEVVGNLTFDGTNTGSGSHRIGVNDCYVSTESGRSGLPAYTIDYGAPESEAYRPEDRGDGSQSYSIPGGRPSAVVHQDDSLDSVVMAEEGPTAEHHLAVRLKGSTNEAYDYDGDAETDVSYVYQGSPVEPSVRRNPDPFPVLERPASGRYQKNPTLERKKPSPALGPYDPQVGVFLTPPLSTKSESPTDSAKVRKRIPRPPTKLRMKCAFFWSCCACLVGNFLCAIPALRYSVTASESRKIGDYNSANSYLRKAAILATVAIVLAAGAWIVLILFLMGNL